MDQARPRGSCSCSLASCERVPLLFALVFIARTHSTMKSILLLCNCITSCFQRHGSKYYCVDLAFSHISRLSARMQRRLAQHCSEKGRRCYKVLGRGAKPVALNETLNQKRRRRKKKDVFESNGSQARASSSLFSPSLHCTHGRDTPPFIFQPTAVLV